MVTVKQLFIHFLKDNNAYEEFIYNFNSKNGISYRSHFNFSQPTKYFPCSLRKDFIYNAFAWIDTTQGFDYWCRLSYNWERTLRENHINKY